MAITLCRMPLARPSGSCWPHVEGNDQNPVHVKHGGKLASANLGAAVPVSMDCFGLSDIGMVRPRNEDQFLIADLMKSVVVQHTSVECGGETDLRGISQAKLLLVADGVGGSPGGDRASSLAVEAVVQYFLNVMHLVFRKENARENQFLEDLKSALAWSQQYLQHAGQAAPRYWEMGTTLTFAYLAWPSVYLAHVGDSRAYVYRAKQLIQLTHDQTIAQMLADAGAIDPSKVQQHHFRNVLGSVLCCDAGQLHPSVQATRLAPTDQLLLCTDGLTKHLTAAQIAEILDSAPSAEHACRELIAAANAAGGSDNTTVVVARFDDSAAQPV